MSAPQDTAADILGHARLPQHPSPQAAAAAAPLTWSISSSLVCFLASVLRAPSFLRSYAAQAVSARLRGGARVLERVCSAPGCNDACLRRLLAYALLRSAYALVSPHLCDAPLHDEEVRVVDVELHRLEQVRHTPGVGWVQGARGGSRGKDGTQLHTIGLGPLAGRTLPSVMALLHTCMRA